MTLLRAEQVEATDGNLGILGNPGCGPFQVQGKRPHPAGFEETGVVSNVQAQPICEPGDEGRVVRV